MTLKKRILIFLELGQYLKHKNNKSELEDLIRFAKSKNAWFTEDNVKFAIDSIVDNFLDKVKLDDFLSNYTLNEPSNIKNIGIVPAGNIPLVGFHDIFCTVLSGHKALVKPSSNDDILLIGLLNILKKINPEISNHIELSERLNSADAFIATGSDNSARYFEYYFSKKPHIIRKNRTSIAILDGTENKIELGNLGNDIFRYFGLGCRNVSKLFVPSGYNFDMFFESIEYWNTIQIHHKYNNNYDYNKSIYLVNRVPHLDNGFLLLKKDENLVSPISVLFFEEYANISVLKSRLLEIADKTQVIVSKPREGINTYNFGDSQHPYMNDFADGIDTLSFLISLDS